LIIKISNSHILISINILSKGKNVPKKVFFIPIIKSHLRKLKKFFIAFSTLTISKVGKAFNQEKNSISKNINLSFIFV